MLTVFVSDIFGQSLVLKQLADKIALHASIIIDPYGGQIIDVKDEQVAYDYFTEQTDLTHYAHQLQEKLDATNRPFNLIAFSVGGSAV